MPHRKSQAAVLIVAIELTKLKVKQKLAHEKEQVWEEANYVYGAFLRLAFFRLKVCWDRYAGMRACMCMCVVKECGVWIGDGRGFITPTYN